jgi:hypothetical protein
MIELPGYSIKIPLLGTIGTVNGSIDNMEQQFHN